MYVEKHILGVYITLEPDKYSLTSTPLSWPLLIGLPSQRTGTHLVLCYVCMGFVCAHILFKWNLVNVIFHYLFR
jgi:hypothetical protein